MDDFPCKLQNDDFSCGRACYQALLEYFGRTAPRFRACPVDGTDPRTLEHFLRRAGLGMLSGEMQFKTLRQQVAAGNPVVCMVTQDGCGHYVVVYKVSKAGRVYAMNPSFGLVTYSRAKFEAAWYERERMSAVFRHWGIAVWDPENNDA